MRKGNEEAAPFRVRPSRPAARGGEAIAWSTALKTVFRYASMTARKVAKNRRHSASPMTFGQRCAVRITYARNKIAGQWRAHGRYILREGAAHDALASDDVRASAETLGRWQAEGDERLWKFIVSPEFGDRVDLRLLVGKLMEKMERDLGTKLEWIAVNHHNTEHPHAHVALRGVRDDRTALDLPRDYIKIGIRQIAEDLCTQQLGYRTEQDKFEAERREINQTRPTSLDRIIAKCDEGWSGESFICDPAALHLKEEQKRHLQARLAFLQKAGLAESSQSDRWTLKSGFQTVLKSMQQVADRQRTIAAHRMLASNPNLPVVLTDLSTVNSLQGRILGYGEDEQNFGKPYMLIEEPGERIHLLYQDAAIQTARSRGQLRLGSFVHLRVINRSPLHLKIQERGDDDRAHQSTKKSSLRDVPATKTPAKRASAAPER